MSERTINLITDDGVNLTAVLRIPDDRIRGAVVILPGSGNVTFDGDISSPFLGCGYRNQNAPLSRQIADALSQVGMASLRYSKRGSESPASSPQQPLPDLVSDSQCALRELRRHCPGVKMGYAGFSEGAVVSTLASLRETPDALFLLAPLTRPFDQILHYQFVTWPLELLSRFLDQDRDGVIRLDDFERCGLAAMPLTGQSPPQFLNGSSSASLKTHGKNYYVQVLGSVLELGKTPPLSQWAASMFALPRFTDVARKIACPVYVYQAQKDAQTPADWVCEDVKAFPDLRSLELFQEFGHAFCPMEGAIGEIKTSGPLDDSLLEALQRDAKKAFTEL